MFLRRQPYSFQDPIILDFEVHSFAMHANNTHKICMQLLEHYLYAKSGGAKTLEEGCMCCSTIMALIGVDPHPPSPSSTQKFAFQIDNLCRQIKGAGRDQVQVQVRVRSQSHTLSFKSELLERRCPDLHKRPGCGQRRFAGRCGSAHWNLSLQSASLQLINAASVVGF